MKLLKALLVVLMMGASPAMAGGVTRQIYTDHNGTMIGRSYTNQNGQTWYYNRYGQRTGYSYQTGPFTRYYGQSNQYLGDVLKRPNGTNVVRPFSR